MAAQPTNWNPPLVCAVATFVGIALGMLWDGFADVLAVAILLVPVAVSAAALRIKPPRPSPPAE